MIKITSGIFKNHNLLLTDKFLKENEIRITSNYTKQLLMNLIKNSNIISENFSMQNKVVADVCCGSGAIGFEMLSNFAKKCYFIDTNSKLLKAIERNAVKFLLLDKIVCMKSMTRLREVNETIDFLFIDPPYDEQEKILTNFISICSKSDAITRDTVIIAEMRKDQTKIIVAKNKTEIIFVRKAISNIYIAGFRILK